MIRRRVIDVAMCFVVVPLVIACDPMDEDDVEALGDRAAVGRGDAAPDGLVDEPRWQGYLQSWILEEFTFSGSTGLKNATDLVSSDAHMAGGCNIDNSFASSVRLVDMYTNSSGQVCKVHTSTTSSFDVETWMAAADALLMTEDVSCTYSCQTTEVGGSVGVHSVTSSCTAPMAGGGCNIEDSQAASAYIFDSYPSSNTEWTCKVYSENTASFDLQTCCHRCVAS